MTQPIKIQVNIKAGELQNLLNGLSVAYETGMILAGMVPVQIILKLEEKK